MKSHHVATTGECFLKSISSFTPWLGFLFYLFPPPSSLSCPTSLVSCFFCDLFLKVEINLHYLHKDISLGLKHLKKDLKHAGRKKHLPDLCTSQKPMDIHMFLQFFESTCTFWSSVDLQHLQRSRLITIERNWYIWKWYNELHLNFSGMRNINLMILDILITSE